MKIGGKWSNKAFQVSGQYEMVEDQIKDKTAGASVEDTGGDYIFLNGLWNINGNNAVTVSVGQQDNISQSFALAYIHKMSKMTNVYVGYGQIDEDSNGSAVNQIGFKEDGTGTSTNLHDNGSVFIAGLRKSF